MGTWFRGTPNPEEGLTSDRIEYWEVQEVSADEIAQLMAQEPRDGSPLEKLRQTDGGWNENGTTRGREFVNLKCIFRATD